MSQVVQSVLFAVLILSTSVWVGGYVAIAVVARAATATLTSAGRVAFFRSLGRSYLWIGGPALLIALATAVVLLRDRELDALMVVAIVVAVALVALLAIAVAQARRMTRLRRRALDATEDEQLAMRVRRGGQAAGIMRAILGLLSLLLVVLGSFLAT